MISFSRTMLVGGEFVGENLLRLHGVLEDNLYGMEIRMDVRLPEAVIASIKGEIKRYSTSVCPRSVEVLQNAVGMSLREEGWVSRVNREIGRKGCSHFAEIVVECGRCVDHARIAHALELEARAGSPQPPFDAARGFVESHPETLGFCLARPEARSDNAG